VEKTELNDQGSMSFEDCINKLLDRQATLLEFDPTPKLWLARAATLEFFFQDYKKAIVCINDAIKLNNTEPDYYKERAGYLTHLGDFTGAIKDYDEAILLYLEKSCSGVQLHGILLQNEKCGVLWSRDYNAAINIRDNLLHHILHHSWNPLFASARKKSDPIKPIERAV